MASTPDANVAGVPMHLIEQRLEIKGRALTLLCSIVDAHRGARSIGPADALVFLHTIMKDARPIVDAARENAKEQAKHKKPAA